MVSSRISLTAMLAMGLCLSQGTGVVEAGGGSNLIRDLGSDAALALGHKDLSDQITGSFQDAGRKLQSEGGISGLFEHAVRRFGEKAVQNGVPAAVRVAANEAGVPTTPAGNRKLQGGVEPLHLPFHLPTDPLGEVKMVATEVLPHEETNEPVLTRKLQGGGSNFIRDLGSDAALALGHKDLSDQIMGSFQN